MKLFIVLSLAFCCSSLMAMPNVGDMATYQIITKGMTITQKQEITKFDSNSGAFIQIETNYYQGQSSINAKLVRPEDMISDALIDMILSRCETPDINGKLELVTVTAGTFNTCGFIDQQSGVKLNMGHVPFGLVQISGPDMTFKLMTFKNGI